MQVEIMEIMVAFVFFVGFYGLIVSKSVIKSIVSIVIMEAAVVMFFLTFGFTSGMTPPIGHGLENVTDPLPQALMITAIIIGVAVTAINLTMLISLCRQYKTAYWDIIKSKNSN